MRPVPRALLAAVLLAVPSASPASPSTESAGRAAEATYRANVDSKLAAVAKTQGLLADKLAVRQAEMRGRVRAIYKLSRASWPRLWFQPEARQSVAQWMGAARRINIRDRSEIELLHEEIAVAAAAEERLQAAAGLSVPEGPAARSLRRPIDDARIAAAFGDFSGPSPRVRLRRRGIELSANPGDAVHTPAAGRVRYAGPISGLGQAVIVDHEGFWSIIGHLDRSLIEPGDLLSTDSVIGRARGQRVYLEIRLAVGAIGQPVDPAPLLARR